MSEIGICIYWGPWGGKLNPSPIISLGDGAGLIVPEVPSLVMEDQVWMIANDASRSFYSLYAKVPCSNSQDAVQLLINCTMAKERHLVSKSPLDLLEALKAQFERHFVISQGVVRPCSKRIDAAFAQLLSNYPLENCPWYVFMMEGLQPGAFRVEDRNQLDALMRFNAYPALAHVSRLEIGFRCQTTVGINTKGETTTSPRKEKWQWWWRREKPLKNTEPIQPKPQPQETPAPTTQQEVHVPIENAPVQHKGFQVLVNGEAQNVYLRWDDDEYFLRRESTEDYRYESLHFKLSELKSAPKRKVATLSGRTVAQLDEKNGCINCEMKPAERWLHKEISFTADSDVEARKYVKYNPDKMQILIGHEPWNGDKIKPSVAKKALERNTIRLVIKETDNYRFTLVSTKIVKDRIAVTIDAKNKHQVNSETKQFQQPSQQQQKQEEKYEVFLNGKPVEKRKKGLGYLLKKWLQ